MRLCKKSAKLAACDDLVRRALATVEHTEAAAGIHNIKARMSRLQHEMDALCRQRETCLLRVDAQARKRTKLAVCTPASSARGPADAAFEQRFLTGFAPLQHEFAVLRAREAYMRAHVTDVKKAHNALSRARLARHNAQQALVKALGC